MKIIGAGLPRTGTSSLKAALDRLGFGPCYHMFELMQHPEHVERWRSVLKGESPDWDSVFAATDGWGPLCEFLGVGAPLDEPYPHLNDAETLRRMFATMRESDELVSPFEAGS